MLGLKFLARQPICGRRPSDDSRFHVCGSQPSSRPRIHRSQSIWVSPICQSPSRSGCWRRRCGAAQVRCCRIVFPLSRLLVPHVAFPLSVLVVFVVLPPRLLAVLAVFPCSLLVGLVVLPPRHRLKILVRVVRQASLGRVLFSVVPVLV